MPPPPASLPRVYVHTLGCPKNEADSRAVVRSLLAAGVTITEDPSEATHILVNTCGFIQDAKEESIGAILDACTCYPDKAVLVMGCLVERYRDELATGIPEVSAWFGLTGGADEAALVRTLSFGAEPALRAGNGSSARGGAARSEAARVPSSSYAYVKISDGCDERCTFCSIPGIKGAYYSVAPADILREAEACLAEGVRELVLVGQDTAVWSSGGLDLVDLVDLLAADERCRRIRLMYLQPEHVTDRLLRHMAEHPKLCHYLDVPFQHSHPAVLRAMGRWGSGDEYLELLERARRLMPDVSVRSTFIVGFPGEKKEQFEHLLSFVREARFDYAGGFVYSPEEGTAAEALRPRVGRAVARDRLNRLNEILGVQAEQEHQKMIGSQIEVMIDSLDPEEVGDGAAAVGRIAGQAPEVDGVTYVEGEIPVGTAPGDTLIVTVSAVVGYDLVGRCDAS